VDVHEEKTKVEEENTYLRTILSWVFAQEPQLGMMIQQFKKGNMITAGHSYMYADFDVVYGTIGSVSGLTMEEKFPKFHKNPNFEPENPKEGVFNEPPRAPPKKAVWVHKPKEFKNPLDTLPPKQALQPKNQPRRAQPPLSPKRVSQPKSHQRVFHCVFCGRDGHLEEFCFRRKRVEKREREWANPDMFYQGAGRHDQPQRGDRRDARARRAGGGHGDGFAYHAPRGGRFAGQAPSHANGYGPWDHGFGRFNEPRFPHRGGHWTQDDGYGMFDCYDAFGDQMAWHWYPANPSARLFAHPMTHF
jgi:hypothetical protein